MNSGCWPRNCGQVDPTGRIGGYYTVFGLNIVPRHGYRVDVRFLDGDPNQIAAVDQNPDGGLPFFPMTIQQGQVMGRPVNPEFVPTRMQWRDSNGHGAPDFDSAFMLNVSDRAQQLIEDLEPGVPQFLPVTFVDTKDRPLENRWFLIVCNRIDGVDREHSRTELIKGMMWSGDRLENPRLVMSNDQTAGFHLWRDKHLIHGPYLSADLAARMWQRA